MCSNQKNNMDVTLLNNILDNLGCRGSSDGCVTTIVYVKTKKRLNIIKDLLTKHTEYKILSIEKYYSCDKYWSNYKYQININVPFK